ncbi:hypothetical protein PH210_25905 [Paenibacillus sp. BSR1-1]|uniref:hypothetical protein n=1 Tax=Paenibacillus sp. BSR1-1 TaxID=3020845 RepID=UPI0025B1D2CE|nr:hypothetical protein [Paenibacillus sp. BSR1-1]MDN3019604.1 hypothetical protein [Paenibacillus sp. BSR1-1]
MNDRALYFKDNFFSAGRTEIFNSSKEMVGELDLKSAFSSSIDVLDKNENIVVTGKFTFFSSKWRIYNSIEEEIGVLKEKLTFLSKKYEYDAYERGVYHIKAEPFSKQYEILDEQSNPVGRFEKVSGFFASPAFQLSNFNEKVTNEELIAVVMGINAIQKRNASAASNSGGVN